MLIEAGLAAVSITAPGGFLAQLPPNQIQASAPMAWASRSILAEPSFNLTNETDWTEWHVQIDCHGFTSLNAVTLAKAIMKILRGGYRGTLSDPDSTTVQGIWRQGTYIDGFSPDNRSYVRSLEYLISYNQT